MTNGSIIYDSNSTQDAYGKNGWSLFLSPAIHLFLMENCIIKL